MNKKALEDQVIQAWWRSSYASSYPGTQLHDESSIEFENTLILYLCHTGRDFFDGRTYNQPTPVNPHPTLWS